MRRILLILTLFIAFGAEAQKEYALADVEASAPQIGFLNVSQQDLLELPGIISNCKKLKKIHLRNNPIDHLPEWLGNMKSIEELDISGCRRLNTKQAFEVISKLPNLKVLKANGLNLMYLPVCVRKNTMLKEVELSNNQIPRLPPVFELLNWEKLDLSYNCLDTLPASFVFMNTLKELNLSYNPAAYNLHNYYILEYLTSIKTLSLSGMTKIPEEIGKLSFLEELIVTNGEFSNLPEGLRELKRLKKLDARGCKNIKISDLIEGLSSAHRTLNELKIGHVELDELPYNLFKLKRLKQFYIDNSCINSLPSSFNRFKGREIYFRNCSFSTPEKVFMNLGKAKNLTKLEVNQCVFGHNSWKIKENETIKEINILNCGLVRIPLDVKGFTNLRKLNLKGNRIPKNAVKWTQPTTILGAEYESVFYSDREVKRWKYTPLKPEVKRMIYSEIGDIYTLKSGTEIEIQKGAFITTGNADVTGDVELHIREFNSPFEFAESNFPSFLPTKEVADHKYAIEIRAYHEGEEVFIKSNKPIVVKPFFKKVYSLDKYYYLSYKNQWQLLEQQVDVCSKKEPKELKQVCQDFKKLPQPSYNVRVSKVHLRIKRNKRKKTLNFEIEPEYGYLENQVNIFGDRIKGYPELKHYKGIKWKYVGDSLDKDLERLYFLSESAKKEKMNRKSTFYFYVLDIKDIRVFPNPNDDNYLLQFIQGRDTFSVATLPFLSILKAKKIQRWHRRKFKKYKKALVKRKEKWLKLDTTYLAEYEKFEFELEAYRQNELKSTYTYDGSEPFDKSGQVLKIYKPGLYGLGIPLLINKPQVRKPIIYWKGKRFKPQRILVSNLSKGYSFWANPKAVVKERGVYEISVFVEGELYKGKWGKSNKVELEKVNQK